MPETFRVVDYLPPDRVGMSWDLAVLRSDERRLRRKRLELVRGDFVLVDFPQTLTLERGGALLLEDGRQIGIVAAEEYLYDIRGRDTEHLMQLAWHLGNRHLPIAVDGEVPRLLILRDHVIRDMLIGLGASVTEISEPFEPLHGAYHAHAHGEPQHALLNR